MDNGSKAKERWGLALAGLGTLVALGAWLFPISQPVPSPPPPTVIATPGQVAGPIDIAEARFWSELPERNLFTFFGLAPDWTYRFIVVLNTNSLSPLTGCRLDFRTNNKNGILYNINSTSSDKDDVEYKNYSFSSGMTTKELWLGTKTDAKLNLEALRIRARCDQYSGLWHDVDLSKGIRGK